MWQNSSNDFHDRLAMVDLKSFATGNLKLAGVKTKLPEDRRMNISHVVSVLDGMEADFIGRAVSDATFDSAASHPD